MYYRILMVSWRCKLGSKKLVLGPGKTGPKYGPMSVVVLNGVKLTLPVFICLFHVGGHTASPKVRCHVAQMLKSVSVVRTT